MFEEAQWASVLSLQFLFCCVTYSYIMCWKALTFVRRACWWFIQWWLKISEKTCVVTDRGWIFICGGTSFQKTSVKTLKHVFSFHACTRNSTVSFSAFVILTWRPAKGYTIRTF
jgi:hypothetical protein